jgi:hypothetical protein
LLDVEQRFARHQAANASIRLVVTADGRRLAPPGKLDAQQIAKCGPIAMVDIADRFEPVEIRRGRTIGEEHGLVTRAEEAGLTRPGAAAFGHRIERNIVGHGRIGPGQLVGHDGAEVGIADARFVATTELHHLRAAAVVGDLRVQRTDDGRVLHPGRHLRHQLGDVDAGDVRGDGAIRPARDLARLGVPGFELTGAAGEPQQDDPLLRLLHFGRAGRVPQRVQGGHVGGGESRGRRGRAEERTSREGDICHRFVSVV